MANNNNIIELNINNLFFEGGVTMSKDSFIQILQHALNQELVTVSRRKGKYIVKEKEKDKK
jgi:hypothetical protein